MTIPVSAIALADDTEVTGRNIWDQCATPHVSDTTLSIPIQGAVDIVVPFNQAYDTRDRTLFADTDTLIAAIQTIITGLTTSSIPDANFTSLGIESNESKDALLVLIKNTMN